MVGPGFYKKQLRIDSLYRFVSGAAGDYIFNFAVKLVWLKFMKGTNQLGRKTLLATLNSMNNGTVASVDIFISEAHLLFY